MAAEKAKTTSDGFGVPPVPDKLQTLQLSAEFLFKLIFKCISGVVFASKRFYFSNTVDVFGQILLTYFVNGKKIDKTNNITRGLI